MPSQRIVYAVPDFQVLKKRSYACVDMHVHTKYSDGLNSVPVMVKKAKRLGIGLSITDHNNFAGSVEAARNRSGVLVVPGIEVTSKEGPDLLYYFYSAADGRDFYLKHIKPNLGPNRWGAIRLSIQELLDLSDSYNCLVGAPHPFTIMYKNFFAFALRKQLDLSKLDFIEVLNAEQPKIINLKAMEWLDFLGKGFSGGSDAHFVGELGRAVTCAKQQDLDGFLTSMRKRQNIVVGKEGSIPHKLLAISGLSTKNVKYLTPRMKARLKARFGNGKLKNDTKRLGRSIVSGIKTIKNIKKATFARNRIKVRAEP
ncbi:PHP domain-containing protein [Candidatus Woesearchaeota archaeon]|nr:PHP domain-containing protein [Candidatus Woesearchaeota archaeon]